MRIAHRKVVCRIASSIPGTQEFTRKVMGNSGSIEISKFKKISKITKIRIDKIVLIKNIEISETYYCIELIMEEV